MTFDLETLDAAIDLIEAQARTIKLLTSALEECVDVLDDYADTVDGDDSQPCPNRAMALQSFISALLVHNATA